MRAATGVLGILLVLALGADRACAGKLREVREEVRTPRPRSDSSRPPTSVSNDDDDDDGILDEIFAEVFGPAIGQGFLWSLGLPFIGPHYLLDDDIHRPGYFLPHPYAEDTPGSMVLQPFRDATLPPYPQPEGTQSWSVRAAIEDSYDFEGVNRATFLASIDTTSRFGAESAWTWFHEPLETGGSDDLTIGDANLTFRFAQNEFVQMRAGLGARMMVDEFGTEAGFNFTYAIDIFPEDPFVLSAVIDLGNLGEAFVFQGRFHLGAAFDGWEPYVGYDFLRIGSVTIQGPVLGVRRWF